MFRLYEESVKAILSKLDVTSVGEAREQEMEIDHPGEWPPSCENALHLLLVGRPVESQQLSDSVARTYVVAGKDMKSTESSK